MWVCVLAISLISRSLDQKCLSHVLQCADTVGTHTSTSNLFQNVEVLVFQLLALLSDQAVVCLPAASINSMCFG